MLHSLPWLFSAGRPASPADVSREPTTPPRPKIGLALGGGAARGFAHIGILRVLRDAGLAPEIIAGTSIGAVVGGCYLAGKLDILETWARALTRRRVIAMLDFSIGGAGLLYGSRLTRALENELGDMLIEDLPSPFAAVATEIGPGHEIWITRGPLVMAMRASLSLPGIFEPVRVDERLLMDGALVNPVPVNTARALGGNIIVAVNLSGALAGRSMTLQNFKVTGPAPPPPRNSIPVIGAATSLVKRQLGMDDGERSRVQRRMPGISTVMMEAFNISVDRIARLRLAGDPPDLSILPRLGDIGPFDFHRAGEVIDIGAEAAERMLDTIRETVETVR